MRMIPTANRMGRPTSVAAARIERRRSAGDWTAPAVRRTMFSTMTTEPSTSRPKSIAPRLMRFPEMPARTIAMKATSIDSGIAEATIRPPRRLPRSNRSTAITRRPPSTRFLETVAMTRETRACRS
jgi:hypothetical protein